MVLRLTFMLLTLPALLPSPSSAARTDIGAVVDGNTRFALRMYKEITTDAGNIFMSPHSIASAMAMTYMGASGNTKEQMSDVFGFDRDVQTTAGGFSELSDLIFDDSTQLYEANRLFGQEGYAFLRPFLEVLEDTFESPLESVDFTNKEVTLRQINSWVAEQTEEQIRDLVKSQDITALTRLVIVNALYFNGTWEYQFDSERTRDRDFHLSEDSQISVPTMQTQGRFKTSRNGNLKCDLITLPYTENDMVMTILKPEEGATLEEMEALMDEDQFQRDLAEHSDNGNRLESILYMPKFQITHEQELNEPLKTLGMSAAFESDEADFTDIESSGELYISKVLHQAAVGVNEAGTEAAGATAAVISGRSSPATFRVDKPFAFVIQHQNSEEILFMGRVVNPTRTVMARRSAAVMPDDGSPDTSDVNGVACVTGNVVLVNIIVATCVFIMNNLY